MTSAFDPAAIPLREPCDDPFVGIDLERTEIQLLRDGSIGTGGELQPRVCGERGRTGSRALPVVTPAPGSPDHWIGVRSGSRPATSTTRSGGTSPSACPISSPW